MELSLSANRAISPILNERFQCVASKCEDTCCGGWGIPIDRQTYEKYQALPDGPLRSMIESGILLAPEGASGTDGFGPDAFAKIRMTEDNACPMHGADGLCQIQSQLGHEYLSKTCASYPRIPREVGGIQETALSLSCPEAVRVVLTNPMEFRNLRTNAILPIWPHVQSAESGPAQYFWSIRNAIFEVLLNRAYPLWERLFLIGILCHQLEAIFTDEPNRDVTEPLAHFSDIVLPGTLRLSVETLPLHIEGQLDAVLRLAGLMLNKSIVTKRFTDCLSMFATGIGNRPGATLEDLAEQFAIAHDAYFEPFMERHEYVLENYLINTMVRNHFPFGKEGVSGKGVPPMAREFGVLLAQFTLMKGLLIGVAGFHRENFAMEHVVHTVQAASKHFDHHPEFPQLAYELLSQSNLHGLHGAAILLRNRPQPITTQTPWPLQLPAPAAEEIAA